MLRGCFGKEDHSRGREDEPDLERPNTDPNEVRRLLDGKQKDSVPDHITQSPDHMHIARRDMPRKGN